jgi:heme-degrading monooxygenase HmoA
MAWSAGRWTVKAGREADFIRAWTEFARWSATTFPGSRAWLLRDRADPTSFLSVGPWRREPDLHAWRKSEGFSERMPTIREMPEGFEPMTLDEVASVG